MSLSLAPDAGEWICRTTMRQAKLADGRTLRTADGVIDNCGRASFRGVLTNCMDEPVVLVRVRQSVDQEHGPSTEFGALSVPPKGRFSFDVETRGIGELTVAAELETAGGDAFVAGARARVRQVSVTIAE